jgi:hypothetical protein
MALATLIASAIYISVRERLRRVAQVRGFVRPRGGRYAAMANGTMTEVMCDAEGIQERSAGGGA